MMETLKQLLPLLLTLSLGLLVVSSGMRSARGDFVYVLRNPKRLFVAFVAILLVPLIAGLAVISAFPISAASKAGILLMAISPVPPLVPGKAAKFGGDREYINGLQSASALMAVIWVPVIGSFLAREYAVDAQFPAGVVGKNILVGLVLPLLVGILLGRWLLHGQVDRVARLIVFAANILLVAAVIPILIVTWPIMLKLIGNGTVIAMALVVVVAIAGGHCLGGKELRFRSALAFSSAMRHPGIALALVGANHADQAVSGAVLLFLIVGFIVLIPYQFILRGKAAGEEAA